MSMDTHPLERPGRGDHLAPTEGNFFWPSTREDTAGHRSCSHMQCPLAGADASLGPPRLAVPTIASRFPPPTVAPLARPSEPGSATTSGGSSNREPKLLWGSAVRRYASRGPW